MMLGVVGTGYVGLITVACLADLGHQITAVDRDGRRISTLSAGRPPFHEPGLGEVLGRVLQAGRIRFTTEIGDAVRNSEVLFITVGTPSAEDGTADLTEVAAAADAIASALDGYCLIVEKSTVPVRTGERIRNQIQLLTRGMVDFDISCGPSLRDRGCLGSPHHDRVFRGSCRQLMGR